MLSPQPSLVSPHVAEIIPQPAGRLLHSQSQGERSRPVLFSRFQGYGSGSTHGSVLIWVDESGSTFKMRIWVRIQKGKNDPQNRKSYYFYDMNYWVFSLEAESFCCSLCVLYGGLGKVNCIFRSKKYIIIFQLTFVHQNTWSETGSGSAIRKNAGSGPAIRRYAGSGSTLNQCGSATLVIPHPDWYWSKWSKKMRKLFLIP